jgi:hypothetical protein
VSRLRNKKRGTEGGQGPRGAPMAARLHNAYLRASTVRVTSSEQVTFIRYDGHVFNAK